MIHASGRSDVSQELTTDKDLMLSSGDKLIGMKLRSATLERLDDYRTRAGAQRVAKPRRRMQ